MTLYLNWTKGRQRNFLIKVRSNLDIPWINLAKKLKVSKGMMSFYLNEKHRLSFNHFKVLCDSAKLEVNSFSKDTIEIINKEKKIKLPKKTNKKLAEFLGILAGDGHIGNSPYEVDVVGDKRLDKTFIEARISFLFRDLFNLKPTIIIHKKVNYIKSRAYSKSLVTFLNLRYGLPSGKKKYRLYIPKEIIRNKSLLKAYLRGIFDTDGSFYGRRNNEPVLQFTCRDSNFNIQIKKAINSLGFSFKGNRDRPIYNYSKKEINKFFKIIKPRNKKHLAKYGIYKQTGKILKTDELVKILSASVV